MWSLKPVFIHLGAADSQSKQKTADVNIISPFHEQLIRFIANTVDRLEPNTIVFWNLANAAKTPARQKYLKADNLYSRVILMSERARS